MPIRDQVASLIEHMQGGKIIEAMEAFYDPDCAMAENGNPPTIGLEANIERENAFLAGVKEWTSMDIHGVAVDEDAGLAFIEYSFSFINQDDQPVTYEQVSAQRWKSGKIVSERFYYDSAA